MQVSATADIVVSAARSLRRRWVVALWLGLCLVAGANTVRAQVLPRQDGAVCRGSSAYGVQVLRNAAKVFAHTDKGTGVNVDQWDDVHNIDRFCAGDCQVLFHRAALLPDELAQLEKQWPEDSPQPQVFIVGHVKVAVIVHQSNPIRQITLDQIQKMLRIEGASTQWQHFGGRGGKVSPYGEGRDSTSRLVIRRCCMMLGPEYPTGYYLYREDFEQCDDADEVVKKVRADRNGIGFILYQGQRLPGVKLVPVASIQMAAPVALKEDAVIQQDYPLGDSLALYLRPDAPQSARLFCEFAISPAGSEIAARHGLVTPVQHISSVAQLRFGQVKAGRGARLLALGIAEGWQLFQDCAEEYVRAKEAVQLQYARVDHDVASVGTFVNDAEGTRALLVLTDGPGERAMQTHGEKWRAMGEDGRGPAEHVVAARVAAVIVNQSNPIHSLTMRQIQEIYGGTLNDWSAIPARPANDASGTSTPEDQFANTAALLPSPGMRGTIKAFGLRANDSVTPIFEKECLPRAKWRNVRHVKDTAEAVAAVTMDPQAIAFVDITAIPNIGENLLAGDLAAPGQTVKIIAIAVHESPGEAPTCVLPVAGSIRNGSYPLSQRLHLYVHPKASETAKAFAAFLGTGGRSTTTPYFDTVKPLAETMIRHGLVPLAQEHASDLQASSP